MLERQGLQVTVINVKDGKAFWSAKVPNTIADIVEVSDRDEFALKLKITGQFDWKSATGLEFYVSLSSHDDHPIGHISRPPEDRPTTVMIPDCHVWDDRRGTWLRPKFRFSELERGSQRPNLNEHLRKRFGSIILSVKRCNPTQEVSEHPPKTFRPIGRDDVNDAEVDLDIRSCSETVLGPSLRRVVKPIEGTYGNVINFVFRYRSIEWFDNHFFDDQSVCGDNPAEQASQSRSVERRQKTTDSSNTNTLVSPHTERSTSSTHGQLQGAQRRILRDVHSRLGSPELTQKRVLRPRRISSSAVSLPPLELENAALNTRKRRSDRDRSIAGPSTKMARLTETAPPRATPNTTITTPSENSSVTGDRVPGPAGTTGRRRANPTATSRRQSTTAPRNATNNANNTQTDARAQADEARLRAERERLANRVVARNDTSTRVLMASWETVNSQIREYERQREEGNQ